jgi:transglutaminase-like putative cysteine protease
LSVDDVTVIPFTWKNHDERDGMLTRLAAAYSLRPEIRMFALDVLSRAGVPERDPKATGRALHQFFRDNIPYQMEAGEQVVLPGTLLAKQTGGDCDDQSLALASMLASLNLPTRFDYWQRDGHIVHVSVGLWDGDRWVNIDPIVDQGFDWTPPGFTMVEGRVINPGAPTTAQLAGLTGSTGLARAEWSGIAGSVAGAVAAIWATR